MVKPNSGSLGFTQRVGTIVIGWLSLIWSVWHLLLIQKKAVFDEGEIKMICIEFVCKSKYKFIGSDLCPIIAAIAMCMVIVAGVICALLVLVNVLLVCGVHQNRPGLMIPHIFYRVMEVGALCITYLAVAVFGNYIGNGNVIALTIIIFSLVITLDVYFLLVVTSCYKQMKLGGKKAVDDCIVLIIQEQQ